ncbi:MAG: CPBP family intramembrane metalloprotease [Myxococcales bacterium]|nr:CPBP family intramembrane metalloprotease [Myxococcales bacterium]
MSADDGFEGIVDEWTWNAVVVSFYLPVAVGSLAYLNYIGGPYAIERRLLGDEPSRGLALGVVVGLVMLLVSRVAASQLEPFQRLAVGLSRVLGELSWPTCIVVALASAIGEELLFRAVIQAQLGLGAGALLFACAHVPMERDLWLWPVSAFGAGLVFGVLYQQTGGVLAPAVAHFVINVANLHWMGRFEQ